LHYPSFGLECGVVEGIEVTVSWTRAELTAIREAVELTPRFDGRVEVRDAIRTALRPGYALRPIVFERGVAERFAGRLVTVDLPTALAKVRLLSAIRDAPAVDAGQSVTGSRAA
jgi:hypothetical protein